jgi:competence protein ComEA
MALSPEARRQRASFVLGFLGLLLLAAVLGRAYTQWVAARYAPAAGASTVDVNRADAAALERLPGIGPVLARRIMDERAARGPFSGFADLRARVDGVGEGLALALDGLVTFGD